MPVASKLSASSTITPEIWSKIFHLATFIPDEWDAVANRVDMGILYFKDLQAQAYFSVLPLRRTIVEVCQLWHKIGTKLLYASFHCTTLESEESSYRLAAFAHVLVARPHLGRLVKRLALPWSPTVTDIELIIRHCPNAIIFSSLWAGLPALSLPWVRSLPESLRGLEANVGGMEVAEIMRILFTLPNLELLRMWNFGKAEGPSRYPRLRFPALRVLFLLFDTPKTIKSWVPILSNMDAPKLTALCTDIGKLSCAASSFPRDIWERITYLAAREKGYRYIRHTYLLNLKHLHLPVEENHTLQKLGVHFPFHQLENLTLYLVDMPKMDVGAWKPFILGLLVIPLDTKIMPSLRVLELDWGDGGLEAAVKRQASHEDVMNKFLISLGSLAVQVEKRGVCFLEVQRCVVYHTPALIQEVVAACKQQVQ